MRWPMLWSPLRCGTACPSCPIHPEIISTICIHLFVCLLVHLSHISASSQHRCCGAKQAITQTRISIQCGITFLSSPIHPRSFVQFLFVCLFVHLSYLRASSLHWCCNAKHAMAQSLISTLVWNCLPLMSHTPWDYIYYLYSFVCLFVHLSYLSASSLHWGCGVKHAMAQTLISTPVWNCLPLMSHTLWDNSYNFYLFVCLFVCLFSAWVPWCKGSNYPNSDFNSRAELLSCLVPYILDNFYNFCLFVCSFVSP